METKNLICLLYTSTDNGKALKERIGELQELLNAYRSGRIIERT